MASIINTIGIILVTIGTVSTLWTIMRTNPQSAGTWEALENEHKEFPKEQRIVKIGCGLIILGGIFQIVGQFI